MKYRLDHLPEYTDSAILEEIRRVASIVSPSVLTTAKFKSHSRVGLSTVRRHFGTWRDALSRAGVEHLYNHRKVITEKMTSQHGKGLSDDELLDILRDTAGKLNRDKLSIDEFNESSTISAATVIRRFGGWAKALEKAGLSTTKMQRRYSDEECFENILAVWAHYGRPPKYHEMPMPPSTISVRAYIGRWGTWRKALQAFVDYINGSADGDASSDASGQPDIRDVAPSKPLRSPRKPEAEERHIRLGLRYKILKRDRFSCVLCGRSPATHPGIELQVDHIKPWSKGGRTVADNLQTTCRDCNAGKGNNYL